jgi:L-asparaginase
MRHITLITTGGTIEKTYDEMTGELTNRVSIVDRMLEHLRLEDTRVKIVGLMRKDSLHMTDEDRSAVVRAVQRALAGRKARGRRKAEQPGGIVILHGTDTLTRTGDTIYNEIRSLSVPIVLTGAMRPFEMTRSDALQNLTEAVFAAGMLEPGVYCAAHGRVLAFPGVKKDRTRGTFVK